MNMDLNADVGEGAGTDAELMKWITSANVCCGMHAGDAETSFVTLQLAKSHGVICGAHPGFANRENFGRVEQPLDRLGAKLLCLHQIAGLTALSASADMRLKYVKPHGAFYHAANRDPEIAGGILEAIKWFPCKILVALPDSQAERAADEMMIDYIREGFADRRYLPDGSLVPRTEANALLHDPKEVVDQVEWLVKEKQVQTICVHGDTPGAVEFVRRVREFLLERGHTIRAFAEH